MNKIFYCSGCDKFTLAKVCECGVKTESSRPGKFSLNDKFGKYRRMAKGI